MLEHACKQVWAVPASTRTHTEQDERAQHCTRECSSLVICHCTRTRTRTRTRVARAFRLQAVCVCSTYSLRSLSRSIFFPASSLAYTACTSFLLAASRNKPSSARPTANKQTHNQANGVIDGDSLSGPYLVLLFDPCPFVFSPSVRVFVWG